MAKLPHKSGMSPVDLARHVLRSHHAIGGTAGRQHFESGGDDHGSTTTDAGPAQPSEKEYLDALNSAFQANFGRDYNPKTDSWWMDQLKAGKEDLGNLKTDVASGAQGMDQARLQYLPTLQNLYRQNFGRDYNPATDSWWLDQLASGKENPANLARDVLAGAQGRDKLYVGTYTTPIQNQVVTPLQQNPSRYVGIPSGGMNTPDVTPAPVPTGRIDSTPTPGTPATQQYGTYAGQGTTPSAPVPSTAQSYVGTPWNINAVQNYMSPNPLLGYQFNAPNLISAPLMNQQLANAGGPGISGVPSSGAQAPVYTPAATDMSAYTNAYNSVMTNPDYVGTTTPTKTTTTATPTFKDDAAALAATTNPTTAKAGADYLAAQAAKSTGLPAADFSTSGSPNYKYLDIPTSSYIYTPQEKLPSQSEGYLANLAAARANPAVENALQGAAEANIPGFGVRKRGGRTGKNKSGTGAFVKKALMVVSSYKPKRSKQAG